MNLALVKPIGGAVLISLAGIAALVSTPPPGPNPVPGTAIGGAMVPPTPFTPTSPVGRSTADLQLEARREQLRIAKEKLALAVSRRDAASTKMTLARQQIASIDLDIWQEQEGVAHAKDNVRAAEDHSRKMRDVANAIDSSMYGDSFIRRAQNASSDLIQQGKQAREAAFRAGQQIEKYKMRRLMQTGELDIARRFNEDASRDVEIAELDINRIDREIGLMFRPIGGGP